MGTCFAKRVLARRGGFPRRVGVALALLLVLLPLGARAVDVATEQALIAALNGGDFNITITGSFAVTPPLVIHDGYTVTVGSNVTLTIERNPDKFDVRGKLINQGTIESSARINVITDISVFENHGVCTLKDDGYLDLINTFSTITNSGTLTLGGNIETVNRGIINNSGVIHSSSTVENAGTINNNGTINNSGVLINRATSIINNNNTLVIWDAGVLNILAGSTYNGNPPIYMRTATPIPKTGDGYPLEALAAGMALLLVAGALLLRRGPRGKAGRG